MLSMTGFGSGQASVDGASVTVELRSVNHRFLDVALKLPSTMAFLEGDIRTFLKEKVARGRITCSVQLERASTTATMIVDRVRLEQGIGLLREAADRLQEVTDETHTPRLEHLLAIPDLFVAEEPESDAQKLRAGVLEALAVATDGLIAMKSHEGAELTTELERRIAAVRKQHADVVRLAPEAAAEAHTRLSTRIQELIDEQIDPPRLAQEIALLADRANINEECERLGVHLDSFQASLTDEGQVAKRLNFLLQEMHREVNTMGSKTNLMAITQLVIAMKEEIESMREQIQNLE